jgi:hypothetical protein
MPSGSREEVSSHAPCPFWATPLPHVGLFHITTIRKCVRVPTHAPLCSAEFAGGVSVTAFHARFIALRVSRRHGACASPRHLGERNDTSTAPKLSKTLRSRPFIPDTSGHFEGTDRSFPMWWAFPTADYYDGSVTVGLAPCRSSHVPVVLNVLARRRCPVHLLEYAHCTSPIMRRVRTAKLYRYAHDGAASRRGRGECEVPPLEIG